MLIQWFRRRAEPRSDVAARYFSGHPLLCEEYAASLLLKRTMEVGKWVSGQVRQKRVGGVNRLTP